MGSYNQMSNPDALVPLTQGLLDKLNLDLGVEPRVLVQTNAAVMGLGGAGLALGVAPRLSALALAGALVPTTLAAHRFWEKEDARARMSSRNSFLSNAAIVGGLLAVAGTKDTKRPKKA